MTQNKSYRVGVVKWQKSDGIAQAIGDELSILGHQTAYFDHDKQIPADVDIVFSFAPYGDFVEVTHKVAALQTKKRLVFVHWNTESIPDLNIPAYLTVGVGALRSWVGRLNGDTLWEKILRKMPPFSMMRSRMYKFRYVGDYHYAYRNGWLTLLADTSQIYARFHQRHGVKAVFGSWGTSRSWYEELGLERDIDVLWMGNRRTKRRNELLERIRSELSAHGVNIYVADNVENPFIFGKERLTFLNRSKITLNLLPTWHDNALPLRFHAAAGNRSLVVSEPILPHSPYYEAGMHYVAAPVDKLTETILHYLRNSNVRHKIVENAYQLVTTKLTFTNSVKTIIDAATASWRNGGY